MLPPRGTVRSLGTVFGLELFSTGQFDVLMFAMFAGFEVDANAGICGDLRDNDKLRSSFSSLRCPRWYSIVFAAWNIGFRARR